MIHSPPLRLLVLPLASALVTAGLAIACSSETSPPSSSTTEDAAAATPEPVADAGIAEDAAPTDSGKRDVELEPLLADVPAAELPQSCAAYCEARDTTCSPACALPSSKTGAGYVMTSHDDGQSRIAYSDGCSEALEPVPDAIQTVAKCCCLLGRIQRVTKELTGPSSCEAECQAKGFTCDERGYVTFERSDGTTCGRSLDCADVVSPTATCSNRPSVGASLECRCR